MLILIIFVLGIIAFLDVKYLYPDFGFKAVLVLLTNFITPFVNAIPLGYYIVNENF